MTRQLRDRLDERTWERMRATRDLHETLLQGFHGLMLRFQVVAQQLPPDDKELRSSIEDALGRADVLMIESRERIRDLRNETSEPVSSGR
jgi:signal transduction histidine kinase